MASTDGTYLINAALNAPSMPFGPRLPDYVVGDQTLNQLVAELKPIESMIDATPKSDDSLGRFFNRGSVDDFHKAADDLDFSLKNAAEQPVPVLTRGSFKGENAERFNNAFDLIKLMTRVSSVNNQAQTVADASINIFNVLKTKAAILLQPLFGDTPAARQALASIAEVIRDDLPTERRADPVKFIHDLAA